MNVRHFKAGDEVDAISTAGEAFTEYELGGIRAGVFEQRDAYYISVIQSDHPGSGQLGAFLAALRAALSGKPVRFVNVINRRLAERLTREGFEVVEMGEDI